MLLRVVTLISLIFIFIFYSCSPQNSQIVARFGNQTVGLKEFEKAYAKNAESLKKTKIDSLQALKNYLNLYVDFRMKLRDAFVRGFDQDSALQAEVKDYKNQIGTTYLLDKVLIEPALKKLYNERKWEYRVSHIMIRPVHKGPAAAKKLAESILDSLKNGADWNKMVKKYSEDQFSARDNGDLFYLTAGELPASFENAYYATEPGHIYPHVVKTQYGYHIIKVTDKRLRRPEIRVSHILIAFRTPTGKLDSTGAWAKADSILKKIKAGGNFAKLAEKYSDDPGSKNKGGDIGYIGIRATVKPFAEAAFNLKKVGDVSGLVKSRYGYHIIKLTGIKKYPTFDEVKDRLKQIYKKLRYQADYDSLVARLERKYNYKLNENTINTLAGKSDTVKVGSETPAMHALDQDVLFTYNNNQFDLSQFYKDVNKENEYAERLYTADFIKSAANKIAGKVLIDVEADSVESNDSNFIDLMKDYKNGIYIFKLQQDEVWNRVKSDSSELYKYYEKHKDKYLKAPQIEFSEIYSKSDSLIKHYYSLLKSGSNFDSLAAHYTERLGYKDKDGRWEPVDSASSSIADDAYKLEKPGDYSKPVKMGDGYSILKLIKKIPSRIKTFEEAKTEVASEYQEADIKKLENDYIARLKKLYKPKIYYNRLEEAFKNN